MTNESDIKEPEEEQQEPSEEQPEVAVETEETGDAPGEEEAAEANAETPEGAKATDAGEPEPREPLEHQLLRLRADFDNYRKRITREKAVWTQQALGNLLEDLLPVIDHFEMGLENAIQQEADAGVVEGFKLVQDQFLNAVTKYQLQAIDAVGEVFDPESHEAITLMASDEPADTVINQVRKGYRLGDRLLRPAQVVVSSGPVEAPAEASKEADAPAEDGEHE